MKDFIPPIATDAGLMAQMACFTEGIPVSLTKMVLGSGRPNDSSEIPLMTDMVCGELEIPIVDVVLDSDNPNVTVCGVIDYMQVETPFNACELGLFIESPLTGDEVLYCYTYSNNDELAPAKVNATELINITTLISRTQDIVIAESKKIPYVLRQEFYSQRALVSEEMPTKLCGLWLRPFNGDNNAELWDDYGAQFEYNETEEITYNLWAYFGNKPPDNKESLWFESVD